MPNDEYRIEERIEKRGKRIEVRGQKSEVRKGEKVRRSEGR